VPCLFQLPQPLLQRDLEGVRRLLYCLWPAQQVDSAAIYLQAVVHRPFGTKPCARRWLHVTRTRWWPRTLTTQGTGQLLHVLYVDRAIGVPEIDPHTAGEQRRHLSVGQEHGDETLLAFDGTGHHGGVFVLHPGPFQGHRRDHQDPGTAAQQSFVQVLHQYVARVNFPLVEEYCYPEVVEIGGERPHPVLIGTGVGDEDVPGLGHKVLRRGRQPYLRTLLMTP
jgi:hypothetical protein